MSVLTAEIHRAVTREWFATNLDWLFKQRWAEVDRAAYTSLNDGEAAPGTPFPFCIFSQSAGIVTDRMSGHTLHEGHIIQDVPWSFRIHAGDSPTETAKEVSLLLAEHVLRIYGGHPDPANTPRALGFDSGALVCIQYLTDYGMRTGDTTYQWAIEYRIRIDQPIAI